MNEANIHDSPDRVARGSSSATCSETVLDEYVRLDKIIRDCEHALLIAERLNVRPNAITTEEIEAVRTKLKEMLIERAFLDEWISRRGKSPNPGTQRGRDAEATNATEARTRHSLK